MYDPIETFEVDGLTVEIHQDDTPTAPSDWSQLGELVAFSPLWREYQFAQRESTGDEDEALERGGLPLLARYLRMTQGAVIVPFMFDDYGSGGARLYASSLDDDRAAGFMMTTPERIAELGAPETDIERQLRGELRDWGSYVEGAIVGVVVRDKRGKVLESVWGFYPEVQDKGDDGYEYVRDEGRAMAEAAATERRETADKFHADLLTTFRTESASA